MGLILISMLFTASVSSGSADDRGLAKRLDAAVARLLPGRTLPDLKADFRDSLIELEPSAHPVGRSVYLIVSIREAGRSAWQAVICDFDPGGRLVRCLNEGPSHLTQTVAEADWNRIAEGASLPTVYRTIGPPGEPILGTPPGYDSALEYMVALAKPTPYFSSCAGRILLKKAVVAAKELMCE
jgi:hypothetical protein